MRFKVRRATSWPRNPRYVDPFQPSERQWFRIALSRIGLPIALLGFGVLGISLHKWAQTSPPHRLYYTEDEYQWVRVDTSNAPAIETDELWQASATCQLPYFVKATMQAKVKLKAHNDLAPEELQVWRSFRPTLQPPSDKTDSVLKHGQEESERNIAEMDYDAELHAKYTEWYVTMSKLEDQVKTWEQRLSNVVDRTMTFGEARRRSADARKYISNHIEQESVKRDLERYVLVLMGLGGFSNEQEQAIKADCINVVQIKKIITTRRYYTELWRWPIDHAAMFWFGLELVFVGGFFSPIARWISSGNSPSARRFREAAKRLYTRNIPRSKFSFTAFRRYPAAKITTGKSRALSRRRIPFGY